MFFALVLLHVAAALFHALVRRDGVFEAMAPCRFTTRSRAPNDRPVLVDAVVNRSELAMPSAVTLEMAKGFTLYIVKAVISGRGD